MSPLDQAQARINAGEYDGAIQELTEFLQREPGHAFALLLRGVAYAHRKDLGCARADLEASLASDPRDARAHYNAGWVAERSEQPDRALEYYEESVRLDDAFTPGLRGRADLRFAREDYEGALRDYSRLIDFGDVEDAVLLRRGVTNHRLGRIEEALGDYDAVLARSPDHSAALYNRALAREEAGDVAAALSDFERAAELDPSDQDAAVRRDSLRSSRNAHPADEIRCIGCGEAIAQESEVCPNCRTRVRGARYGDVVDVVADGPCRSPGVCSCCLHETDSTESTRMTLSQSNLLVATLTSDVDLEIPFCLGCKSRRFLWKAAICLCAAAVGAALVGAGWWMFLKKPPINTTGFVASIFVAAVCAAVVAFLARKYLYLAVSLFRGAGHVRNCDAFETGQGLWIEFRNYAFSGRWRDLNGYPREDDR